ncbi:MAG: GNAT family N-acetyltransferase [Actinomycetes bacterium]
MGTEFVSDDNEQLRGELERLIYRFNVQATGIDDGLPLRLAYRAGTELLAGLVGWTWGGSGCMEFLWVREDQRGQGLGSTLLADAEAEAVSRGCHQMLLSTHTFQAPRVYTHRGYREYGLISNYPDGHGQLHLVKRLIQQADARTSPKDDA